MEFSVLGALEVRRDGRGCDLGAPKQRALLVRLLIDVGRPVSVDRLIDDLWAGAPPARASASLQAYVSNLRRILEPDRPARAAATVLVTQAPGYALRVPAESVDSVRFRTLAAAAAERLAAGDAVDAHASALAALALWRGPALADVADEPFAAAEIRRLDDLRLATEEVRLAAALELGRSSEVVAELETLVTAEPLRERCWELLVLALYRSGRTADALDRYQRIRRLLDDELGLEPGPALRELESAVLRQDPALLPRRSAAAPTPAATPPAAAVPARPEHGALQLDAAGRPPLVGRDAELAGLRQLLEAARHGVTRWALLTGDPGIGKSRLAEAVADDARGEGWHVATARGHDDADTPAHWMWAQALRGLPGLGTGADAFGELTARARGGQGSADGARFALYSEIARALATAAAAQPVLIVLDDLQWADPDSLRALRFLAVELRGLPLAIVATLRDGEPAAALHEALATLDRQPGVHRLPLPPLDPAAVRAIAEAVTGDEVGADAGRRLHERSGGNPFFATELVRLAAIPGDATALPVEIREAVERRLDRLPPHVRGVLTLAAVAGLAFDTSVLAPASDHQLPELLDQLDPALATGVVLPDGAPLRFRFAHALLREALLAPLTVTQRQRLHARLARTLATRHADERSAAELAHHLVEAGPMGDLPAAVDAARRAGRQALDDLAFDDAARWFDRALDVAAQRDAVHGPDARGRHELLVEKGDALYRSGRAPQARRALADAIATGLALGDGEAVARAAAALSLTGGIWMWADLGVHPGRVLGLLESALERFGDDEPAVRARLLSTLAVGSYYLSDDERVDALSAQALDLARSVGDPQLLADVLLDRSTCRWTPDSCTEAAVLAEEALRLEGLSDLQLVIAHGRRYAARLYLGDLEVAVEAHRAATRTAERARLLAPQMQLSQAPAALALAEGRFADAEALLARAWGLVERGDVPVLSEGLIALEIPLRHLRGQLAQDLDTLVKVPRGLPVRPSYHMLALGHLAVGDPAAAEASLRAAAGVPRIPWLELVADTIEAEVRAGLPPSPEAEALADRLLPYTEMIGAVGTTSWWGPVALHLGALERRLGRLDAAEAHLRACLDRSEAWGTRTWTAQARWQLAAVLADRRGADAEATALRSAAVELADEIGLALPGRPAKWLAKSPAG